MFGQENPDTSIQRVSSKYINQLSSTADRMEKKLSANSEKALKNLKREEENIKRKLQKIDSSSAAALFANAEEKYKNLEQRIQYPSPQQYIPRLDSLSTSLKFLQTNPQWLPQDSNVKETLETALSKTKLLDEQLQKADEIRKFIKERKEELKDQLEKFGYTNELKRLNKQAYYYAQQVKEYKEILNDPKRLGKKTLELLSKTKLFKDFFRRNSMLASMFRIPGVPNDPSYAASLSGLQTRTQVNGFIQQQIPLSGSTGIQQVRQQMQQAQNQLTQLEWQHKWNVMAKYR